MNIEQAFIKSVESGRVVEIVNERLNGSLKSICLFREVVRERGNGWDIVQVRNNGI